MATRAKKAEKTPEQVLAGWMAGSGKVNAPVGMTGYGLGWEAGQVGYVTLDGLRYERFDLPDGTGYVVIEWDVDGNVCVL